MPKGGGGSGRGGGNLPVFTNGVVRYNNRGWPMVPPKGQRVRLSADQKAAFGAALEAINNLLYGENQEQNQLQRNYLVERRRLMTEALAAEKKLKGR